MVQTHHCQRCGSRLQPQAPPGMCDSCLLEFGVEGYPDESGDTGTGARKAAASPISLGDYDLLHEIARGGMGVVYRARQRSLNRFVAVKLILVGTWASESQIRRFKAEAEAAARLDHPNIVPIYEISEEDGQPFFSMKLIEGENLAARIHRKEHRFSFRGVARLVSKLARAVHCAHQRGILHRDLKPTNILLDSHDEPYLTDFGLAKVLEQDNGLTISAQIAGTPSYMAPEQAAGQARRATPATDIYSLGAILYELLAERPPFTGETQWDILRQVREKEPGPPSVFNGRTPRDLEIICLKCLHKEPHRRYPTAEALADDLERWLAGKPVLARAVGPLEKLVRWCRRNPAAACAGLLLLLLALGSTAAALRLQRETARAQKAERESEEKLWASYLAQARAERLSHQAGRRNQSLSTILAATKIRPSLQLRNEAIAAMALPDIYLDRSWEGYPDGSTVVAFDGRFGRYARADRQGRLSVRDVATDRELVLLPGDNGSPVVQLFFSPDGELLAAHHQHPDQTSTVRVWDLPSGKRILERTESGARLGLAFHPDGNRLAVCGPAGTIHLLPLRASTTAGRIQAVPGTDEIHFDSRGERLAARAQGKLVQVLDVTGSNAPVVLEHSSWTLAIVWSPDGSHVAVSCSDQRIHLWRLSSPPTERVFPQEESMAMALAFDPRGGLLASSSLDGSLRLWDTTSGLLLVTRFAAGQSRPQFHPDNERLGFSLASPKILLWKVADGTECRRLKLDGYGESISFSPDGRFLACATRAGLRLYRTAGTAWEAFSGDESIYSALFEADGSSLITSGYQGVQRWALAQNAAGSGHAAIVGLPEKIPAPLDPTDRYAALSRDGRTLAVLGLDRAYVGTPGEAPDRWKSFPADKVVTLALSGRGRWLALAPWTTGEITVWDLLRGELAWRLPVRSGRVHFSPSDQWLLTSTPAEYSIWETEKWNLRRRIPRLPGETLAGSAAFSPDGTLLALTRSARSVQLLDTASGDEIASLESPAPAVIKWLCFSPDGGLLASLTHTHEIQLWDLRRIRSQLAALGLDW